MRAIKFRAWDKGQGDDSPLGGHMRSWEDITTIEYNFWWDNKPRNGWWRDIDFTLMQFTGFHDPAGAEIYERDIVYIAKAKEHREIRFSDGAFRIFACDGDSWPMNQERALGLMVAGNAFENPELLTP